MDAIVRDRAVGALLGLAVGDALGTTLEFGPRKPHGAHTEMIGGGPFSIAPGEWTDDTAMAVALADSLIAARTFDPADVMARFVDWWRRGASSCTGTCFDIGLTTQAALARFEAHGAPFAGDTDPRTAGNGSLMRLAPAVIFALGDDAAVDRLARQQSRLTHGAPEAVDACAFFAARLCDAILQRDAPTRADAWDGEPAVAAIAAGSAHGKPREAVASSGYVIHTLEAALWAVSQAESFEDALIAAVNLGDDADTVGAVTGQLAGAVWGARAIPHRWLVPLAWREGLRTRALWLLSLAKNPSPAAGS